MKTKYRDLKDLFNRQHKRKPNLDKFENGWVAKQDPPQYKSKNKK